MPRKRRSLRIRVGVTEETTEEDEPETDADRGENGDFADVATDEAAEDERLEDTERAGDKRFGRAEAQYLPRRMSARASRRLPPVTWPLQKARPRRSPPKAPTRGAGAGENGRNRERQNGETLERLLSREEQVSRSQPLEREEADMLGGSSPRA